MEKGYEFAGRTRRRPIFACCLALAAYIFLLISPHGVQSAEITKLTAHENVDLIFIVGRIEQDDHLKFAEVAESDRNKVVFLHSEGGYLVPGIAIGLAIRQFNMATAISDEGRCASVCALIWLAGKTRYLEPDSKIGFHAAYHVSEGRKEVSSVGNAQIGYYLSQIDMAPHIIRLVASARPDEIDWLTADDLLGNGIAALSASAIGENKNLTPRPWSAVARPYDHGPLESNSRKLEKIGRSATTRFDRIYRQSGIIGAERESWQCWAKVRSDGSSDLIQNCYSFDLAGYRVSRGAELTMGFPKHEFFQPLQLTTRISVFMKKHGYTPMQIDESMHFFWNSLPQ